MARQNINVNPTVREFEAYMDFSGGINTETSNERLLDNEFLEMKNVNLNNRGSVKKRTGYSFVADSPTIPPDFPIDPTNVQGVFFYFRQDYTEPDIIFAKQGRLYVQEVDSLTTTAVNIPITGLPFGVNYFQKERTVEAVQFFKKLYVATGTDIVIVTYENSTWTASTIKAYEPNAQELKFIGYNSILGFAMQNSNLITSNPTATIANDFDAKGIVFKQKSSDKVISNGLKNDDAIIDGYITHKVPSTGYDPAQNEYNFYYRKSDNNETETKVWSVGATPTSSFTLPTDSTYDVNTNSLQVFVNEIEIVLGGGFTETSNKSFLLATPVQNASIKAIWKPSWKKEDSKFAKISQTNINTASCTFRPLMTGTYDIKFEVVFKFSGTPATTVTREYVLQDFQVKYTLEKNDVYNQEFGGIRSCNKIRLHSNRLFLFGDITEPSQVYFSHLDSPSYFPTINMFRFDTGKREPVVTIERIQNYLVVFTRTSVYTITGSGTLDFAINLINDSIGCIAPRSAVLTGNVITFLSEEGVYTLKPTTFRLDQLNVQRADTKIKTQVPKDENACAIAYDAQYFLCFPNKKIVYRYYYEKGSWVKDESSELDFLEFLQYAGVMYAVKRNGTLLKKDDSVYTDNDISYNMVVETKFFDLSKTFNYKKLKKMYILGRHYKDYDAQFYTTVIADNRIILDPESGTTYIDPVTNIVSWITTLTPNVEFQHGTTLGIWELSEDDFGQKYLSVQKARVRGKCHRVKVQFVNSQDTEVELFGFGLEFKLKKP